MKQHVRLAAAAAVSLLLAACGGGGGDKGTGTGGGTLAVAANGSTSLDGTAGTAVSAAPSVLVTQGGTPKAGIAVTFAVTNGGGSVTGATTTTNASGVATVGSWRLGNTAGANTMTATAMNGSTVIAGSPVTFTATGAAGAASKLAFSTVPSTATAGSAMGTVVVDVQDQFANLVTSATNTVTIALSANPGASTLAGTMAVAAVGGHATFTNLVLDKAAANYSLTASAAGLTSGTSGFVTVAAGAPAKLRFVTQPASAAVGASLGTITVEVLDANDNRVTTATTTVTIGIANNPGLSTLSGTRTVNAVGGVATFTGLSLNNPGSNYTLAASASGMTDVPSASFTISAVGAAAAIQKSAGDAQTAASGATVTTSPQVRVVDQNGSGVPGQTVTFAVTAGNGYAASRTQTTDGSGYASVGSWMLGRSGTTQTLVATSGSLPAATFSATATAVTSQFNIQLVFVGATPSAAVQAAFTAAVNRWQEVIVGDRPPVNTGTFLTANTCFQGQPDWQNQTVDDILIFAKIDSIDGPSKILGQAGPCGTISEGGQARSVVGSMVFDSADVASMVNNGTVNEVILHEMGHVLGIGSLWGANNMTTVDTSKSADPRWMGAAGNSWYQAVGGLTTAPIENCAQGVPSNCGPGTRLSHWREYNFANELMTGYIGAAGNPMSRVTLGALQDQGFVVNFGVADAYNVATAVRLSGSAPRLQLIDDVSKGPLYLIDRTGRVLRRVR